MAKRLISSEIFHHPVLIQLPMAATLLWVGLILEADGDGRVCVDVTFSHRRLFSGRTHPSHDGLRAFVERFESASMLVTYSLDGLTYAEITNFHVHQKLRDRTTRRGREEKGREEN